MQFMAMTVHKARKLVKLSETQATYHISFLTYIVAELTREDKMTDLKFFISQLLKTYSYYCQN